MDSICCTGQANSVMLHKCCLFSKGTCPCNVL